MFVHSSLFYELGVGMTFGRVRILITPAKDPDSILQPQTGVSPALLQRDGGTDRRSLSISNLEYAEQHNNRDLD